MGMGLWPIQVKRMWKSNLLLGGREGFREQIFPLLRRESDRQGEKSLHSSTLFLHMAWEALFEGTVVRPKGRHYSQAEEGRDGKAPASWWTLVQYSKNLAVGQALSMCWSGQSHGFGEGCFVAAILAFYYTLRFLHIPYYQLNCCELFT